MHSPESRALEIAGRLTAAIGTETRTTETPDAVRVEVDVPDEVSSELLTAIVDALSLADRYGHDFTATSNVAWAEVTRRGTARRAPAQDEPEK